MKAMILAAGLGTRLRPLTNDRPKAMVRVKGIPLLEIVINRLKFYGIKKIIINTHHFAPQISSFLEKQNNFDIDIQLSHEAKEPLETGGALKKARSFFSDGNPFLLCNTDILSDIDPRELLKMHLSQQAMATLATRLRSTTRYLIFDKNQILCGWTNVKTGEVKMAKAIQGKLQLRAFSGIQIIDPSLFSYFPTKDKFSIIDAYLSAAAHEKIISFSHDEGIWLDAGKIPAIEEAGKLLDQLWKG